VVEVFVLREIVDLNRLRAELFGAGDVGEFGLGDDDAVVVKFAKR
jgi:hypothetical protein